MKTSEWIYPELSFEAACEALLAKATAKLTIITKGAEGALGYCKGHRVIVPAHPVGTLIDTVGAGDTFMGTVLSDLNGAGLLTQTALSELTQSRLKDLLSRAAKAAASTVDVKAVIRRAVRNCFKKQSTHSADSEP